MSKAPSSSTDSSREFAAALGESPQTQLNEDSFDDTLPELSPGRVLVVDDTAANVRLLTGILKLEGFEVFGAHSGPEALQQISEVTPDVVLLDVMMPEMDGFEVCARIRSNSSTAHLPIVMVTALQETRDRVRALETGADDLLSKPVDEVEVVARVRSLVKAKRGRDALQKAYSDLQEAEQMRDSLASMLVHDLRTPLTTMLVSLDLLRSNGDSSPTPSAEASTAPASAGSQDEWQQQVFEMCARSGRHMLSLVNELLDVSRLESGEMPLHRSAVEVQALVEDAVAHVQGQARGNSNALHIEIAPGLPVMWADGDLLRRVLVNLLGNAVKFTRPGTQVGLSVTSPSAAALPDRSLLFTVRDEGEGVPQEDQNRIFDKFAQAGNRRNKRRVSSGLGLTFCKLAVEAHGGRIWVESEVGKGSTFFFSVPLLAVPHDSESEDSAPTPSGAAKRAPKPRKRS